MAEQFLFSHDKMYDGFGSRRAVVKSKLRFVCFDALIIVFDEVLFVTQYILRLVICDPTQMFEMIENLAALSKVACYPQGVVELYRKIADQGYTIMFLTNR